MSVAVIAPSRSLVRLADAALLLVALVWGTSYGVAKNALGYYPVLGFLAVRFLLTAALLGPVLWRLHAPARRQAWAAGLPLGAWMLAIFLCETYGVAHTDASLAAFLISLCVVWTPLVEWALLQRRPRRALLGFVALSVAGAVLLTGAWSHGRGWGLGEGLMLAAALLRAITVCQTARLTRGRQIPALALTAVQSTVIGLGSLAFALAGPQTLPPLPTAGAFWGACAYLVLGCTVFAFFVQNWALRHSEPSRVALLMGSEPVFGALFGVLCLGESMSPVQWLGGALVVGAALWMSWRA
ncbi:MAG: EamA family transporter [Curvibacter sp.]|nr:EamA family transporter [Curvibacter sp.]